MIETMINNAEWVFSGVGTLILSLYLASKITANNKAGNSNAGSSSVEVTDSRKNDYKATLGLRHMRLRENILGLSLREMTEFYGFESVSELEKYENGCEELPLNSLKKAESFFFLNPKYLESGEKPVFETFSYYDESIEKLFDDGFFPTIACCQEYRDNMFAYVVFSKEERGFVRIVASDTYGAFMSTGGGKMNIEEVIRGLIRRRISAHEVNVLSASKSEWGCLERHDYYDTRLFHAIGAADWECMDIFYEWYKDMAKELNADENLY